MLRNAGAGALVKLLTMQLAIFPCKGIELLANEPLSLQPNVQACHGCGKLVLHDLQE